MTANKYLVLRFDLFVKNEQQSSAKIDLTCVHQYTVESREQNRRNIIS